MPSSLFSVCGPCGLFLDSPFCARWSSVQTSMFSNDFVLELRSYLASVEVPKAGIKFTVFSSQLSRIHPDAQNIRDCAYPAIINLFSAVLRIRFVLSFSAIADTKIDVCGAKRSQFKGRYIEGLKSAFAFKFVLQLPV
ncbi:hypothetical protein SCP_1400860 [Sparassis crispa]|uniref:Uncharacterized protein n=1 Tax=Sparassis crispa TaxID=139825 RepID=A0A401H2M9_9APHY|nr:hypothetical protein SCP_1400860 [Sparassis crispa]GBE88681.1 hypothetical protein SCP_1400860 [Sparassis crispa]